jgi:hypothetical protein
MELASGYWTLAADVAQIRDDEIGKNANTDHGTAEEPASDRAMPAARQLDTEGFLERPSVFVGGSLQLSLHGARHVHAPTRTDALGSECHQSARSHHGRIQDTHDDQGSGDDTGRSAPREVTCDALLAGELATGNGSLAPDRICGHGRERVFRRDDLGMRRRRKRCDEGEDD